MVLRRNSLGVQVSDYWYAFDNNSNRTQQVVNNLWTSSPVCSPAPTGGTSTSYGYNGANELTTVGSNTYAFDGNGSETTGFLPSGTSLTLGYDNKNRTTSMTPSGGTAENEVYRGYPQNELLTWGANTYKDGVLGTYRSATTSASTYYVRDNRGHILESTSSGTRYFYVTDYQGSVLQTVDINGTIANTYAYDPYGNASKTGSVADNWTYIGGWQDSDTNLYHLGARFYDPLVGRFTQQDPVQQVNRYAYAAGDPIVRMDPSGLLLDFSINLGPVEFGFAWGNNGVHPFVGLGASTDVGMSIMATSEQNVSTGWGGSAGVCAWGCVGLAGGESGNSVQWGVSTGVGPYSDVTYTF